MSSHGRVALARRVFQALPVQNPDPPMRALDLPRFLQDPATSLTVGRVDPSIIANPQRRQLNR